MELEVMGAAGAWTVVGKATKDQTGIWVTTTTVSALTEIVGRNVGGDTGAMGCKWRLGGEPCEARRMTAQHPYITIGAIRPNPPSLPIPPNFVFK